MIYTVTFNPALDYVMNVDNMQTGIINRAEAIAFSTAERESMFR